MQGISNQDTHLHPLHNNSSVHLTKIPSAINYLQTGFGRFRSFLRKWSLATSANCECGAENQTLTMFSSNVKPIDLPVDSMA